MEYRILNTCRLHFTSVGNSMTLLIINKYLNFFSSCFFTILSRVETCTEMRVK